MDMTFKNPHVRAEVSAVSSKSEAHRALICAAVSNARTHVICPVTNADIDATASCLRSLGAGIERTADGFIVTPIFEVTRGAVLDCNESGSTLRFLLPLAAALGADCAFMMRGRLAERPLSPLYELLRDNGISLSEKGTNPLNIKGKLTIGSYTIAADVSSQYISGLLFALSITEGVSHLSLSGNVESAPYIDMTLDTLRDFGADIDYDSATCTYTVRGKSRLISPLRAKVTGDWSGAAFFITAGVIGKSPVTVTGLSQASRQGDRAIVDVLKKMGARIEVSGDTVISYPSHLDGIEIDARDIPDLVPILASAASVAQGKTLIYNASRLRLKESDRIQSTSDFLCALGADVAPTQDGLIIVGKPRLSGGEVDSQNDHRIAMSAAIASLACENEVTIHGFEAINKSYPTFGENFE